ncbi:arginine--tRNA ligase [Haliovirga abyssi]|uniref:Arginine--tRNA ligase n=1 Tax=Haliovirga abyssi TaxID=2996794 RepID=A0AAU9DVG9_9FUSO|nr:arginine--tRNA ligase [Haliovirga abyssi]BDU50146.1 arginine--tRNA ligase [Haliovirga abyssi]
MLLKEKIKNLIIEVLKNKKIELIEFEVEKPKEEKFGDFSSNIAMKLAKILRKSPRDIANDLKEELEKKDEFKKVEIAGAGFINFYLKNDIILGILEEVLKTKDDFGKLEIGENKKVMVEYISANPTGHLHVGHGRGAVVGDVIANSLIAAGYDVLKEYYINDAGKQIENLSKSVYLRYKEVLGEKIDFLDNGYNGEYIYDIAREIKDKYSGEKNKEFDSVKDFFTEYSLEWCLSSIKKDLNDFGIKFDNWFSEKSLYEDNKVLETMKELEEKKFIYEKDGAKWFKTTDFGDDKDRVVIRDNGTTTYYASDIAYHENKIKRGYTKLIDVWGADHHGYVKRVKASLEALGYSENDLDVILVQIVNLYKDGQPFVMSKRTGNFITLRELMEEVGKDAARIFFIMRSSDSQFDFDLEAAKEQSSSNPAYYIQYAHARICSILDKAKINLDKPRNYKLELIKEDEEIKLIKKMDELKEVIELVSRNYEVHRLVKYSQELAGLFHTFYNKHKVLTEDEELTEARLALLLGVKITLKNILTIMGVSAPERM